MGAWDDLIAGKPTMIRGKVVEPGGRLVPLMGFAEEIREKKGPKPKPAIPSHGLTRAQQALVVEAYAEKARLLKEAADVTPDAVAKKIGVQRQKVREFLKVMKK